MKKQSKTAQIRALLEQGKTVADVAKKLKVKPAAVYQVRYQMNKPARLAAMEVHLAKLKAEDEAKLKAEDEAGINPGWQLWPEPVQEYVQPDPVNHPKHYKAGGIETIDFIEAKRLGYHLGNVVKYISRAQHKGGMQDLLKAQWYLNRAIEKGEVNE
jgi:hypothetical protein